MAHGQPNDDIRLWLLNEISPRVKALCVSVSYYPGQSRIEKCINKAISSFEDEYSPHRVQNIMEEYDEDDLTDDEIEEEIYERARLEVLGTYYEDTEDYGYEIDLEAVNDIVKEMESDRINKDLDFENVDDCDNDSDFKITDHILIKESGEYVLSYNDEALDDN